MKEGETATCHCCCHVLSKHFMLHAINLCWFYSSDFIGIINYFFIVRAWVFFLNAQIKTFLLLFCTVPSVFERPLLIASQVLAIFPPYFTNRTGGR